MKIVAIDIGGTSIKAGYFIDGQLTSEQEIETGASFGGEHIFKKVCKMIDMYEVFDYIGISTAGQVNSKEGFIIFANENIPDYSGLQFKKRLESLYQVEILLKMM